MCTLTVIPLGPATLRVAFNRDESRTRPAGLPPRVRQFGVRAGVSPTDPLAGGTWLAVNDAGLVLALLNGNPPTRDRAAPKPPRSRGEVIPSVLDCDSLSAALSACEQLSYRDFAPFRLVLVGGGLVADVRWDGCEPMVMSRLLGAPQMFTSSGLGDHLVEGPRRMLFEQMFESGAESWEAAQYEFHRHRWAGREHLSVNMSRESARTVSHSVITLDAVEAVFAYHPDAPDQPAELTTVRLPLAPGAA
jgi:hypothetical protein